MAMVSCQRDEIIYPVSDYYLSFDFSESSVRGVHAADINRIYSVTFFEEGTNRYVYSTYINPFNHPAGMPEGGYIRSVEPGVYNVVVYGFDSKVTRVNNVQSYKGMYCDTDKYGYSDRVPVIMMPQDMLYDCVEVDMPYVSEKDDTYIMTVKPRTVCRYKRINVEGIRNLENVENVTLYVSGQCPGLMMGGGLTPVEGNSVILLDGRVARRGDPVTKADGELGDLYVVGDMTSFGYSDGGERCMLTIFVTGEGGVNSWAQVDITELIRESDAAGTDEIWVTVDLEVNVRLDGGFDPVADPWVADVTEMELG